MSKATTAAAVATEPGKTTTTTTTTTITKTLTVLYNNYDSGDGEDSIDGMCLGIGFVATDAV